MQPISPPLLPFPAVQDAAPAPSGSPGPLRASRTGQFPGVVPPRAGPAPRPLDPRPLLPFAPTRGGPCATGACSPQAAPPDARAPCPTQAAAVAPVPHPVGVPPEDPPPGVRPPRQRAQAHERLPPARGPPEPPPALGPNAPSASPGPYRSLAQHGCSLVSRQTGLYRSIGDESLSPLDHVQEALRLRFDGGTRSQPVPAYNMQAIERYTSASIADAQHARRQAIARWRARAEALPAHDPSEPFHSALVEEMDFDLDLFDRGDERFRVPLDVLDLVRSGAEVTGVIAYDQAFARKPDPGGAPVPMQHLFSQQEAYRRSVEKQLRGYLRVLKNSPGLGAHTTAQGGGRGHP